MPELPEVEHFRSLLMPLVSSSTPLQLERMTLDRKPPRKFLGDDEVKFINGQKYCIANVLRKGKQIAIELKNKKVSKYLMVHMGMTGRISTPDVVPELKELSNNDYPPPHTYLKFTVGDAEACFSDPRKFGSILVAESLAEMEALAPDALSDITNGANQLQIVNQLSNQSMGIKALLLDQKRVVSGVGNWVADEVLYQSQLHPDQNFLTKEQATLLVENLKKVLTEAVASLVEKRTPFSSEWLFHYRWNNKKTTQDARGRTITFITSGGRTSAIVASIQKKKSQLKEKNKSLEENAASRKRKTIVKDEEEIVTKKVTKLERRGDAGEIKKAKMTISKRSSTKIKPSDTSPRRRSERLALT